MSGKKFDVRFEERKYNEKKEEKSFLIKSFTFLQENGKKNTIEDVKKFVIEKSISELHNPVCSCFLDICKCLDRQKDDRIKCNEYKDGTFLDNTVFSEYNPIYVCIPIEDKVCKNNCLQTNETLSKVFQKIKEEKEDAEKRKKNHKMKWSKK